MQRELIDLVEGKTELTQSDEEPRIKRTNKLESITEVVLNLDKHDNRNNLKDGKPSNTLFMHRVTVYQEFTQFELYTPQYKKLKDGELVSAALKVIHKIRITL